MGYTSEAIGNGVWYTGDCFEIMSGAPSSSVDLIVCDIPYGTSFTNKKPSDTI